MTLADEFERLIESGEVTEDDILQAIKEVKSIDEHCIFIEVEPMYPDVKTDTEVEPMYVPRKFDYWMLSWEAKKAIDYVLDLIDPLAFKNRIPKLLMKRFSWNKAKYNQIKEEISEYVGCLE